MKTFRLIMLCFTVCSVLLSGITPDGAVICLKSNGSFALEYGNTEDCSCKSDIIECSASKCDDTADHQHNIMQSSPNCMDFECTIAPGLLHNSAVVFYTPLFIPLPAVNFDDAQKFYAFHSGIVRSTEKDLSSPQILQALDSIRLII
ncbi:MAG: hypothetical protein HRT88_05205 [Lentisphaeraceae bacterium]|nr:hypothetical protein [Lentisphaeraceae bacterium]